MGVFHVSRIVPMVSNRATRQIKLTGSGEVILSVKYSNKRICCVSNNPKAVNPFLTIQTKT